MQISPFLQNGEEQILWLQVKKPETGKFMQRNMCSCGGHVDSDGGYDIQIFWNGAPVIFFEVRADSTDSSASVDLFDYFYSDNKLGFR